MENYKNKEWLSHKLVTEDTKISDIANICGVKGPTISYYAKKFGIERPSNVKNSGNMKRAALCKDIDWLTNQYITQNKSYDEISREYNIGKTTVARWVNRHGLKKDTLPQHRRKDNFPPVKVSCERCGKETMQKHAKVRNGYGRFCSQSCSSKHALETTELLDKLNEGNRKFFETEEGQELRRENGVKSALLQAEGRRTSIEIKMADELDRRQIEYIEQYNLGNKFALDFFLPEYQIVIECDGDYWHRLPKSIARDKSKNAYVKACGYSMHRFWEREINTDVEACVDMVLAEINEKEAI